MDRSKSYLGEVAFVTGGANAIGRATAPAFAQEGASVVVAHIFGRKRSGNRQGNSYPWRTGACSQVQRLPR